MGLFDTAEGTVYPCVFSRFQTRKRAMGLFDLAKQTSIKNSRAMFQTRKRAMGLFDPTFLKRRTLCLMCFKPASGRWVFSTIVFAGIQDDPNAFQTRKRAMGLFDSERGSHLSHSALRVSNPQAGDGSFRQENGDPLPREIMFQTRKRAMGLFDTGSTRFSQVSWAGFQTRKRAMGLFDFRSPAETEVPEKFQTRKRAMGLFDRPTTSIA